ncbi:MAG: VWA domain-containing protein [Nostoc sp.]|uniref:VWA domain-containing protein n=1 Tax=Nostoc sp. TaxID=1180 RepID=UPI002FF937A6
MKSIEDGRSWKQVLVGFAVDVSGSMEQSIRNEGKMDGSRFESFKDSLRQLSKQTRQEIECCKQEGFDASITVFAYAFGLKESDYCDLLSLLELDRQMMSNSKEKIQRNFDDPYQELADISRRYGIKDMEKYTKWGKEILSPPEARQLSNRLYEYPRIAERLTSLLPETFSQIEERVKTNTAAGAIGGATAGGLLAILTGGASLVALGLAGAGSAAVAKIAQDESIKQERKKLEKPEKLARELANASDDAIRKIIIREIGSGLEKELHEHGDTRMPLEKLADLLESKEDQLEGIESLIYGVTPMKGALKAIKTRFKQELARLPEDTVSVLFILSDGEPTDGDPMPISNALKDEGVYIISCFVTDRDIAEPRYLFDTPVPQWNDGAKLMFNMASSIDRGSVFTRFLLELGWKMPSEPKLFVQVNHSEVLDEFIRVVLSPLKTIKV